MKILLSLFAVVILLISPGTLNKKGVTIKGNIKNADGYFVKLQYAPFLRGNPSFEGFSSISTSVNKEGAFTLKSEKITNAGAYTLIFEKKGFTFPLFEGDNITFNFDANEVENTVFATGKGSGKINVLRLVDFKPITFNYSLTPDEFATETNAKVNLKLSILDAIYKKQKLDGIKGLKDKEGAERITRESPLNEEEFTFLKKVLTLENYEVYNFVATKGGNTIVKTDAPIFKIFNKREYLNITTQNYNQSIIYSILKFEYIKDYQKKNPEITAKEWDSLTATSDAFTWMRAFAKIISRHRYSTGYFVSFLYGQLTWGKLIRSGMII